MKNCGMCKEDLPIESFAWKSKAKGTRQSHCRTCQKDYRKQHYNSNKAKYVAKANAYKSVAMDRNMDLLLTYLASHPCVDCGETDPIVLQFDHVRGVKSFNISRKMNTSSWASLMKEIEKCEVRCANCHFRVTAQRGNWVRAVKVFTDTHQPSKLK